MRITKWLAIPVGLAALAACGRDEPAENLDTNIVMEENLAPPVDANLDMNMGNDMNMVDNNVVNTADNTTNSY